MGPLYLTVTSVFLVLAVSWGIQLGGTEQEMEVTIQELNHKKMELTAQNEALNHEVELLNTPSYIEQLAREKLGLAYKGEIVIAPKEDGDEETSP